MSGVLDLSVYLVTDTGLSHERGVVETVRRAVEGGVTCVQVREKGCSDDELLALLTRVADTVGDRVPVLLDDRPHVARAAQDAGTAVAGVHLGQSDGSPLEARALLGPDAVIGLSVSTAAEVAAAHALPAGTLDYLGVGAVNPTTTKPDHPEPLGVAGFARVAASTHLPCVAIGGIGPDLVGDLRGAGAAGVAVVSAVCAAPDPERAARELRRAWGVAAGRESSDV